MAESANSSHRLTICGGGPCAGCGERFAEASGIVIATVARYLFSTVASLLFAFLWLTGGDKDPLARLAGLLPGARQTQELQVWHQPASRLGRQVEPPAAVAKPVEILEAQRVEQAEHHVGERSTVGRLEVQATGQRPAGTSGDEERHPLVVVQVGTAHGRAVDQDRSVEQ